MRKFLFIVLLLNLTCFQTASADQTKEMVLRYNGAYLPGAETPLGSVLGMTHEVDETIEGFSGKTAVCIVTFTTQNIYVGDVMSMDAKSAKIVKIWALDSCVVTK